MGSNRYVGTQTEKNLLEAFSGESQARNKYTYFASKAKKEGYEQIAALFLETAENEKELFDEDFYCIPKRVFDMCHLDYESIQIIVEQGQMVITNPQYVLSYLGKDMITCLLKQNVDLGLFAKDLVDLLNEQTIEEAV